MQNRLFSVFQRIVISVPFAAGITASRTKTLFLVLLM